MDIFALFQFIKFIVDIFNKLPEKNKTKVIDTVTDLYKNLFRAKKAKPEKKDLKDFANTITEPQWFSTAEILNISLPMSLTQYRKEKFTASVIKLIRSDEFLNELDKRIDKIDIKENDLYEEQCSFEMRKLIVEMLGK